MPERTWIRRFFTSLIASTIGLMLCSVGAQAQPPKAEEIKMQVGTSDNQHRFVPDKLRLQRGKLYRLVLHNASSERHYFSSDGLATHVFSRKTETLTADGEVIAEVHGDVREVELFPGGTVVWYFYPMIKGEDLQIICHKPGHAEAGMVASVEIYGPPPFQSD